MLNLPSQTVGAKRMLDRQGVEEVSSLKKSCVALGDAHITPFVYVEIRLGWEDDETNISAEAIGQPHQAQ